MAQEGVAAALRIDDNIIEQLKIAQKSIEAMKVAADGLAGKFNEIGAGFKNLAQGLKGAGVSFETAFSEKGTLKSLKLIAEAVEGSARRSSKVIKTEAQKAADAAEKEARRLETASRRRAESQQRTANSLGAEASAVLGQATPEGLEGMKQQLRQITALQNRIRSQSFKGNPFLDQSTMSSLNSKADTLRGKIGAIEKQLRGMNVQLTATGRNARMVGTMISMAFGPFMLQRFLSELVKVRGEFELSQRSLAVLIKDEGRARDMFNEITNMAVRSPFSVSELVKDTKQLAAYRIETDKLISTTKMLGDISAGVGVDMNRLILAYGQVKAAEFLKGTELRQFSEAGVNMLGGLAERFSELYSRTVSVGEVMQMVSKRMVKFADVEAVLKKATEAGGTFYQMQEKQADTLQGRITNLGDRIQIMFNEVGASYDGFMKRIISGLENLVANWKAVSNIMVPLLGGTVISGLGGLLAKTSVFRYAAAYITQTEKAVVKLTGKINLARRAGIALEGTFVGIGKAISANILPLLAAISLAVIQIIRNATRLQREVKEVVESFDKNADKQVAKYNQLLDIAMDVTKSEQKRQSALDELKTAYGNILDIQSIELSNIEQMNVAREQHIALIRQQAYEEARGTADSKLVSNLASSRSKRRRQMKGELESFVEGTREEIPGLADLTEREITDAMVKVEEKLRNGMISTTVQARDEFLKMIMTISGASEDTIQSVMDGMGDTTFINIQRAFDEVLEGMEKIDEMFGSANNAFDISRTGQKYRIEIKKLEDVNKEFEESLTNEKRKFYESNPAQRQLDLYWEYVKKARELKEQVAKQGLGSISEALQDVLNKEIDSAFHHVAKEGNIDLDMLELMSEINNEFQNMTQRFQGGLIRWEPGQDPDKFLKTINQELGRIDKAMDDLDRGNTRLTKRVVEAWGGVEKTELSAKVNLLEYREALERLKAEGGFFDKTKSSEIKQRQNDIKAFADDVIALADGFWRLSEEEKKAQTEKMFWRAQSLEITPPDSEDINTIKEWIENTLRPELNRNAYFDLTFKATKEAEKEAKEVSSEFSGIIDDVVDYYKKTAQEKLPKEVGDALINVIRDRIAKFNQNPNVKTPITLPVAFTLQGISDFVQGGKDNLTLEDLAQALLKLTEVGKNRGGSGNSYKSELKTFLTTLKNARKELDKMNDEADVKFIEKLRTLGAKVGINIAEGFKGSDAEIEALINKYKNKLSKEDRLDIELSLITDKAKDEMDAFTKEVKDLWDKYNNSKKLEDWGLIPQEGSSASVLQQLTDLEAKLREKAQNGAYDDATKLADEIAQKRIEITRKEQEEIAKLMYEAQKKSLDKVAQAYQTMLENVTKMRKWENPTERDAAITAEITRGMREMADAQWDAYKSTEAYALAFGDLEGMSQDALQSMKKNLKEWLTLPEGSLAPTEIQAIIKQVQKIDEALDTKRTTTYFGAVVQGFKEIGDAMSIAKQLPLLSEEWAKANQEYLAAQNELRDAQAEYAADPSMVDTRVKEATEAEAKAKENLAEKTNTLVTAQSAYNSKLKTSKKRIDDISTAYSQMTSVITGTISLMEELADAFGLTINDETKAAIDGFAQGFEVVNKGLGVVSSAMAAFGTIAQAAGVSVGALLTELWPLLIVAAALGVAIAVIKAKDTSLQKEVKEHKESVEDLEKAYGKLQRAMDKALDLTSLRSTFAEMNDNLEKQKEGIEAAIAANGRRKQSDDVKDETKDLSDQLDDINEKVEDNKDKWIELLGGIADGQGVAKDWASDWLKSFKETGRGLSALKEDFNDLYDELVVGQLWSRVMGPHIEGLQKAVNDAVADLVLTPEESAYIRSLKATLYDADKNMRQLSRSFGVGSIFSGDTLQRGIETITEQQAQALESILNATRVDVADTNARIQNIESALTRGDEGDNSILSNLRSQTRYLSDIAKVANAVYYPGGHPKGSGAIRVITEMA